MRSNEVREDTEATELRDLMVIYEHAFYFRAVCTANSIRGAAKLLGTTTRSVFNHIQWMQCLTGKKLLQDVAPGQTMKLSEFGNELWEEMQQNFENAVRKLNKNKMDGVVGYSFTEVIKAPYHTYKPPKNPEPSTDARSLGMKTEQQPSNPTGQE